MSGHDKARHHGRQKQGNELPQAKNTPADVRLIRQLAAEGMKYRDIGEKMGIHHTTAWRIANFLDWKHVI